MLKFTTFLSNTSVQHPCSFRSRHLCRGRIDLFFELNIDFLQPAYYATLFSINAGLILSPFVTNTKLTEVYVTFFLCFRSRLEKQCSLFRTSVLSGSVVLLKFFSDVIYTKHFCFTMHSRIEILRQYHTFAPSITVGLYLCRSVKFHKKPHRSSPVFDRVS